MIITHKDLFCTESKNDSIPLIDSVSVNESIFEYGLNCLRESNETIRNIMSGIYIESGYNINENFMDKFNEKFNFKSIVKFIFDSFINIISKIYQRAKALLLKLLYDDKTIKKYKDDIEKYNKQISVDFDHFNYTYLDKDIPSSSLNLSFSAEYQELQDKLEKIGKIKDKTHMIEKINNLYEEISKEINNGYYYNKKRQEVLAEEDYNEPIFQDQYSIALFRFFRDGATEPSRTDIPPYEIHATLNRFLKGKEITKGIEKHKKDIESSCEKICKDIIKTTPKVFMSDYVPIDYDIEFALNRVLKLKCGQLSECCNIYTIAFSAKLDAVKEALIQDKKVLFKVVSDIIINGGKKDE